MPLRLTFLVALAATLAFAGCTSSAAVGKGNFDLTPQRIGWYAGDEARFTLELNPSLTKSSPSFTIDRHFAIEEIQLNERGATVGGDYETRNPDDIGLRLEVNGTAAEEVTLDAANPKLDLVIKLPDDLRDSEYVLEVKLFEVGWVKSKAFRVDVK